MIRVSEEIVIILINVLYIVLVSGWGRKSVMESQREWIFFLYSPPKSVKNPAKQQSNRIIGDPSNLFQIILPRAFPTKAWTRNVLVNSPVTCVKWKYCVPKIFILDLYYINPYCRRQKVTFTFLQILCSTRVQVTEMSLQHVYIFPPQ
jgi:hypothetical protein